MKIIPAFRGEFGLKVRYHVPRVYALGTGYIIEIEPGEEALYPLAAAWHYVPRALDDSRHGGGAKNPGRLERRFIPEPYIAQGIQADIVICPRLRTYGSAKNWPHWDQLAELPGAFAGGAPDSSFDVACPRAWDHDRFLDATIEALRSARLCVATDAGLAHLAVLCGTPLLLITHHGLVAPGPVLDARGRICEPAYWPVRLQEYYQAANHTGSLIETIDGWDHPELVVIRALELTLQDAAA